ncbi:MAG: response regulator [Ignavibacteriae bacterium]|nr:response regulator [Ignavibacteriota bacterium]
MDEKYNKDLLNEFLTNQNNFFVLEWNYDGKFNCSNSFEDLLGYSSSELTNLPYKHHSLISDNKAEEIYNNIKRFYFNGNKNQKEQDIEIIAKSGKSIWFREIIRLSNLSQDDKYISVLFNISDFKKHEVELNEVINTKTNLNNSKDKLISIISHDLRAPFSSLLGFSEILINEPGLSEEERKEYLQYIYDASKIQLEMVNHLLDWTRLQTGTMKFNPQRIDVRDVIDNCVSVLTGSVIRKDIKIKVNGEHGTFVVADERLINQVITNLLSNAVKFTPSGKSISVNIDLYKNDMVEIIVADEGVGIDEKHQDKLFKIDAKYSKVGTAGEKGSGFGLTLVKEIVEKHGGKIWFYSELNKGSEFHFTIPKSEDTILILEEHKDLQKVYTDIIDEKFNNFKVKFCKNSFEALNTIIEKTPSILVTYHKMPLMNGLQLVSSLRKKDVHNKVSVVVLGNDITEKEKNNYNNLNVHTFLSLDASPDIVETTFEKLVSSNHN